MADDHPETCPRCGAPKTSKNVYRCGSWWRVNGSLYQHRDCEGHEAVDKLTKIEALAREHDHPGVNFGAHALARAVLNVIEGKP